jgi:hypothetical protein
LQRAPTAATRAWELIAYSCHSPTTTIPPPPAPPVLELSQQDTSDTAYMQKRCERIFRRFLSVDAACRILRPFPQAVAQVNAQLNTGKASPELFSTLQNLAYKELENVLPEFRSSRLFESFALLYREEIAFAEKLEEVQAFKLGAGLNVAKRDANAFNELEAILADPVAVGYFARFLQLELADESLLFFMEAQDYCAGNLLKPDHGSIILVSSQATVDEISQARARKIYNKYVKVGAPFEINIPAWIRAGIENAIDKNRIQSDLFAAAQGNVMHMMKHDSFPRYRRHALFEAMRNGATL